MAEPDEKPEQLQNKPREKRWRWWIPIRLACLFLILAGAYAGYRWYWHAQAQRRLDAFRAAGYPVTLEELDAWYKYPDGENAADIYMKAFDQLCPPEPAEEELIPYVGRADLPKLGEPLPEKLKSAARTYLGRNKKTLKLLHQAAAIPGCRYPVDFRKGFEAELDSLPRVRCCARLLSLQALVCAEQGDSAGAAQALTSGFALGRSLRSSPDLLSFLVRVGCHMRSCETLTRVLSRTSLPDDQLAALAAAARWDTPGPLQRAMAGDLCMGNSVYDGTIFPDGTFDDDGIWALKACGFLHQEWCVYLDLMATWLRTSELPLPRRLAIIRTADRALDSELDDGSVLLGMFASFWAPACDVDARSLAWARATRTALAIERLRLKTGTLPEKLDELVPEYAKAVLTDPFDGKPLRYRKLEKGYVVYSVGENGKDDGGRKRTGESDDSTDDVSFTVER